MVWKSNDLIRAAMYEMPTRELKLLVSAISRIQQRHGDSFEPVILTVRELADMLSLERAAVYSDIKAMAETLTGRVVRLHDPLTKTHHWTNWCEVTYTEGSGCVRILFREALRPYLLSLKEKFTQYGLDNILRLTSAYHIRLYELLKSWESWGRPVRLPVSELRQVLGAETKGYDQYFTFNGSVLKPGHAAINRHTDVRYRYRPIKQGRAVTAVEFTVRRRAPVQPELPFGENLDRGANGPSSSDPAPPAAPASTRKVTKAPAGKEPLPELGVAVVEHWNGRMPHSPIATTGPDRMAEVGRQVKADPYLHANWRELIDTLSESKTWNGRGPRGRDGQPFHASFRWFLEHVTEVADAAAARRTAVARRRPKATPPTPSDRIPAGDATTTVDQQALATEVQLRSGGAAQLSEWRRKRRGGPVEPAPSPTLESSPVATGVLSPSTIVI